MKRFVILLLLLIAISDVFAQNSRPPVSSVPPRRKPVLIPEEDSSILTYDMYVPRPGSNFLNLGISLLSSETQARTTAITTKGTGYGINLTYAHGLTTSFAYFVAQDIYGYKFDTSNISTSEVSTLGPTLIGIKGMKTYLGSFFYYSGGYQSAILEKRDDQSGLNVFTENDRRDNFQLSGGVGALLGGFSFGGQYTYFIYQETENIFSNIVTKYKAGNGSRWKLYAQLEKRYKIGVAYGEEIIETSDISTAGVLTRNGYGKTEYQRTQLYTIIPISATTDFFGDITRIDRKNTNGFYSKYDYYVGTAAVRISF